MIPFNKLCFVQASLNVASVAINTTAEQDFTIPGLEVGDVIVSINKPSLNAGLGIVNWRVKAANTLSIQFVNATGGAIDPAAETYDIVVARPEKKLASVQMVSM
jgi:hypothetical protein